MGNQLPRICVECHEMAKPGTNRCAAHPPKRSPSSHATSTAQWKRVRAHALERDKHSCVLCGAPATQVDHVLSVANGGTNTLANARSVCASCNLEARPGYTPREPRNIAAKLAELRELLAQTVSIDARLSIKRQIAALEARLGSPAPASPPYGDARNAGPGMTSGVLSRPAAPAPTHPSPEQGWRPTGAFAAADLLGLSERNVRPSSAGPFTPIDRET